MKMRGYSLVEVVVAAAVAAVGVAAGAVIANTLVVQEELNAGAVRASNLQEQAVTLYRLGVTNPADLNSLLPEPCASSGSPAAGGFVLAFSGPSAMTNSATLTGGGSAPVACETVVCTVVYGSSVAGSGEVAYLSNSVTIVRPTIRVGP